MRDIVCPKPAYDRLVESGIEKRILEKKEVIWDIHLHRNLYEVYENNTGSKIFKNAKKQLSKKLPTEKRKLYLGILKIDEEVEEKELDISEFDEFLSENPVYFGFLVLGEELLNYTKYGFPSRKCLEEAITSFCLGEREQFSFINEDYVWRNENYKNILSNSWHGDLFASQQDVSGESYKNLFGEEIFEGMKKDPERKNLNAYYDFWSIFLITSLKYAEAIGKKNMPEIVNWREVLKEVGAVGTCTTEAMFGDEGFFHVDSLFMNPILVENKKLKTFPINIYSEYCSYYPYVKDNNLHILKENTNGNITLPFEGTTLENMRFSEYLIYTENDLPELLKGTYRLFARDRSQLPKIMDYFLRGINSLAHTNFKY